MVRFGTILKAIIGFLFLFFFGFSSQVMGQVTFNGNGGDGFGGAIGSSNMSWTNSGTTITATFNKGAGGFNDMMVIYISTGTGGRSSIDGDVNDRNDSFRRAISNAGSGSLNFPSGFQATHAIAIRSGVANDSSPLFSIPALGSIENLGLNFIKHVGNPTSSGQENFTFSFEWTDIGLNESDSFDFVVTYGNPNDADRMFSSNEAYGGGITGGNPEFGSMTYTTYFEYDSGVERGFRSTVANGNWSETTTWEGGILPIESEAVTIANNVTLNTNATVSSLTINGGSTFTASDGTNSYALTVDSGGSITNNGTFTASDGTVAFAGAGSTTGTIAFNNLNVSGAVNPGSAATVNGTLSRLSGGSIITNTPVYGSSSTLRYNTGASVNPGAEWPTGTSANPINVTLEGTSTQVSFGSDASSRTIGGNLIIGAGATLQLSSAIGGDLRIIGDWTNQGTFNSNSRAVYFVGSSGQTVTNEQEGGIEIDYLINDNMSEGLNLIFNSDLTVQELTNNTILDLNSNNLTVKAGGSVTNKFWLYMSNSTIRFEGAGVYNNSSASFLDLANLEIGGGVFINFDNTLTITNRLVINEGGYLAQTSGGDGIVSEDDIPNYGDGVTLVFTGAFNVNSLASGWGETAGKSPKNVAVEGTGNATMNVARTISGIVTVESGATLNTNGNLTIASGGDLTNSGTINGGVIFPLEISGPQEWRLLSSPVDGATFANLLQDSVFTQGFPGAENEGSTTNVITWNEGTAAFEAPSSISEVIGAAKGFGVYVFEDDKPGIENPGIQGGFPKKLSVVGENVHGDQTVSLFYTDRGNANTDGWNLIGNPFAVSIYPSNFDLGSNTSLNNNVYTYNASASSYQTLVGTDVATELAAFTGFWVKTDATGQSFAINQAAKTQQSSKQAEPSQFIVNMEMEERSSDLVLQFEENGSFEFTNLDAYKLTPLNPVHAFINTEKSGKPVARGHFPADLLDEPLILPLHITNTFSGTASITAMNQNLPADWSIELVHTESGERWDLLTEAVEIELTAEEQAKVNQSPFTQNGPQLAKTPEVAIYQIEVTAMQGVNIDDPTGQLPEQVTLSQNYPNPFNPSTVISYQLPENSHVKLEVFDMLGRQVATLVDGQVSAGTNQATFEAGNLSSGMYIYRLQAGNTVLTRKLTLIK